MVALMVLVMCKDLLTVQLESVLDIFHAEGGLYTMPVSLLGTGVADGTMPVVAEGKADAVTPRALIHCIISLFPSLKQVVPIAE